jgi:Sugar-transfer associated ATP-grasp
MNLKMTRFRPGQFLMENLRDPLTWRVSPLRLIPLWFRGFTTEHILLFGLYGKNWRDYPKDILRYRITLNTNRHVWPVLHDKLVFDGFMKGRLRHVEALFFIVKGGFHEMPGGLDKEGFLQAAVGGQSFVIKPARGGMGTGLLFVVANGNGLQVNGRETSCEELGKILEGLEFHLGYPFIEPHETLRGLFPTAVNTLRVTAYVGVDGRAELLTPVLRVGSSESAPIDNFCKGGLLVQIDPKTGGCVRALRRNSRGEVESVTHHPESGASLIGLTIPFWQDVRRDILAFHTACPAFDLVGWDVLIGEKGYEVIEGNHNPDLRLPLLFRNLSKEAAFRGFMEERGLIKTEHRMKG